MDARITGTATSLDLDQLVGDLEKLLSSAAPYVGADSPFATVESFLAEVSGALGAVGTIDTTVTDLSSMVDAAAGVADALDGVPFVDVVVAPASVAFDTAAELLGDASTFLDEVKTTVEPVRTTVDDLSAGIKDVQTVLQDLTVQVPQYLNTVQILHYLLEIAGDLVPFLKGTAPGDRLDAVVSTLDTVLDDASSAFSSFQTAMAPVFHGLGDVVHAITDVAHGMGQGVQDTLHAFESAAGFLAPVGTGFRKLENAIAPLRWVLDAIKWVVDHVLKPAINWVLKETGLQSLVDGLETKIEGWLGLSALQGSLGKAGEQQGDLSSGQQAAGSQAGQQAGSTFDALGSSLSQFQQGHNSTLQTVASQLITAVTGAGLSDGSGGLPDFPASPPDLTGNGDASAPAPPARGGLQDVRSAPEALRRVSPGHPAHSRGFPTSLALVRTRRVAPSAIPRSGPDAATDAEGDAWPVPPVDPTSWPRTAAMVTAATDLATQLQKVGPDASALGAGLTAFAQSSDVPATFAAALRTFAATFDECTDLLQSLDELDLSLLTALVGPVQALVTQQQDDLRRCTAALPTTMQAVGAVQQAVAADVAALPTTTTLGAAVDRADGWVLGAEQLVATMEAIKAQLVTQGSALTTWTAAHDRIEAAAAAVADRQNGLATSLDAVDTGVSAITAALDAYSSALTSVSQQAQGLVAAVPAAQHVNRILGVVESLVDPLQGLFRLECPAPVGSAPSLAGTLVNGLDDLVSGLTQPPQGQMTSLLAQFDAEALPCGRLAAALSAATTTLTGPTVADLTTRASALHTALNTLTTQLDEQESYTFTDPSTGKAVTVTNDLISQAALDQLTEVVGSLDKP